MARSAWQLQQSGIAPGLAFVEFAADVGRALATSDAALAGQVLRQGRVWLAAAAATLPSPSRENALARHPLAAALAPTA